MMTYFLMRASESREVGGSSGEKTRCCLQCIIFRYVSNERERTGHVVCGGDEEWQFTRTYIQQYFSSKYSAQKLCTLEIFWNKPCGLSEQNGGKPAKIRRRKEEEEEISMTPFTKTGIQNWFETR